MTLNPPSVNKNVAAASSDTLGCRTTVLKCSARPTKCCLLDITLVDFEVVQPLIASRRELRDGQEKNKASPNHSTHSPWLTQPRSSMSLPRHPNHNSKMLIPHQRTAGKATQRPHVRPCPPQATSTYPQTSTPSTPHTPAQLHANNPAANLRSPLSSSTNSPAARSRSCRRQCARTRRC